MPSSYFFTNIESRPYNEEFISKVESYAEEKSLPTYLIHSPLGEKKYTYTFDGGMIVLIPNHKIIVINTLSDLEDENFDEYFEDFFEDLGHLSDRYEYRKILDRPRKWKNALLQKTSLPREEYNIEEFFSQFKITDSSEIRQIELLISLCIGSINSIDKFSLTLPDTLLDKVKQNIILFDGDQTRFIFKKVSNKRVTIQGLAGTGKTELLLHKIKELYMENDSNKIAFTCFNKALANSLKQRVPSFFDFMKVEEQIKWNERLWVMHSWGSKNDNTNIGMYSLICKKYGIPFQGLLNGNFDSACQQAIEYLKRLDLQDYLFDYVLIDESQDFQESFFELCELVTRNTVYVAGDIFQNIFQSNTGDASPDFLLNKCYRTDPRTLMFAHGVGFGLFEDLGIRKLTNEQWEACGYKIEEESASSLTLVREPLRKFTDINFNEIESVKLIPYDGAKISSTIIGVINEIKSMHPNVKPDDIAIVVTDKGNRYFDLMESISIKVGAQFNWKVNSLHHTKTLLKDSLSISNINNIKGLEFPFIICISHEPIGENVKKRNALYMSLTRSFISSYLLISRDNNELFINKVSKGLSVINELNKLSFDLPNRYIDQAELTLDVNDLTISQKDVVDQIFLEFVESQDEIGEKLKLDSVQVKLRNIVYTLAPDSTDQNLIRSIIITNIKHVV